MAEVQDWPIIGVCVVSDPARCPANYTTVDKTYDRSEDADLWKDGLFFSRRVMRYLCVQRGQPAENQDVLVDVTLINEKDLTPPGFTVIEFTHDTREKATKKKCICVRWMVPSMTTDAITELIFLTRAHRRAPAGYTMVGDINNMSLCYKMGSLSKSTSGQMPVVQDNLAGQSYSATPLSYSMTTMANNLPYAINPSRPPPPIHSNSMTRTGPPEQSANSLATGHVNPISGIEWKMNPKYSALMDLQNVTIPEIRGKTLIDIERQYKYDFSVERSVSKTAAVS